MNRVVRIHQYGDASVLKIDGIEVPPPGDEVQIAVRAIGINRAEVMYPGVAHGSALPPGGGRSSVHLV